MDGLNTGGGRPFYPPSSPSSPRWGNIPFNTAGSVPPAEALLQATGLLQVLGTDPAVPINLLAPEAQALLASLQLSPEEALRLLKNLLQLPAGFPDMLALLAEQQQALALLTQDKTTSPTLSQQLSVLWQQNLEVLLPPQAFQALLSGQAQKGLQQLMKLLQSNPDLAGRLGGGDLAGIISHWTDPNAMPATQAMRQLLLFYLPFNPGAGFQAAQLGWINWTKPQAKQADDDDASGSVGEASSSEALTVYVQSAKLGRLRTVVSKTAQPNVLVFATEHEPSAAQHLSKLEADLKQALRLQVPSLQADVFWQCRSVALANDASTTQVSTLDPAISSSAIFPVKGVSLWVLLGAHTWLQVLSTSP